MCAECADRLREAGEIAEASESVMQGMMGFKRPALTPAHPAVYLPPRTLRAITTRWICEVPS